MWKKQLEQARRWIDKQEEKLIGIANGSTIPIVISTEDNAEDEEMDDESDEEERTNHVEFSGLFPEDMAIDDYAVMGGTVNDGSS